MRRDGVELAPDKLLATIDEEIAWLNEEHNQTLLQRDAAKRRQDMESYREHQEDADHIERCIELLERYFCLLLF